MRILRHAFSFQATSLLVIHKQTNKYRLLKIHIATQCLCRELDRTPHLYLVWKVGCKEVIYCIKSGAGGGKQSDASLHRHPLGRSSFCPQLHCLASYHTQAGRLSAGVLGPQVGPSNSSPHFRNGCVQ